MSILLSIGTASACFTIIFAVIVKCGVPHNDEDEIYFE